MEEIKLAVIGKGGVGKSAITIRYVQDVYAEYYDSTIDDSKRKQTTVDENSYVLDIFDPPAQDEYSSLREAYRYDTRGFLFLFSLTDRLSFEQISVLHAQLLKDKDSDEVPIILMGNKSDLIDKRVVTSMEANELASKMKCMYIETSARSGDGVEHAFEEIVRCVKSVEDTFNLKKSKKTKACIIV
ncbi:ras-like protein RAS2-like [Planoprotostelium fungivorum]|uniref:Ras-like protein RAS2-like n=1 Tax=Planoprotostelium fungivorum TaxID=1890364 RepID=A0A2P6MZY5_9EUKA|nr:ras-like protein RAS2-like [Planoprotostelium fungivorum]